VVGFRCAVFRLLFPVFSCTNLRNTPLHEQLYFLLCQCSSISKTCKNTIIQLNSFTKSQVIILYFSSITMVLGSGEPVAMAQMVQHSKVTIQGIAGHLESANQRLQNGCNDYTKKSL